MYIILYIIFSCPPSVVIFVHLVIKLSSNDEIFLSNCLQNDFLFCLFKSLFQFSSAKVLRQSIASLISSILSLSPSFLPLHSNSNSSSLSLSATSVKTKDMIMKKLSVSLKSSLEKRVAKRGKNNQDFFQLINADLERSLNILEILSGSEKECNDVFEPSIDFVIDIIS